VRAVGVQSGGRFGQDLKNSGKTSRYVWASFLSRTTAMQNSHIRFLQSGAKYGRIEKFFPPKAQGSHMPLVRAVYHDLLRRVAERSNQGRNDGGRGEQFPGVESL